MSDYESRIQEHFKLFGHYPTVDLSNGGRCDHPMHDKLTRMINGDGVDLDIDFLIHAIKTDDDEDVIAAEAAYQREVDGWKDTFKAWEEEDKHKADGVKKVF